MIASLSRIEYVFDTSRSTNLAIGDVRVYAVEHVFAALKAYQIDNLVIELTNLEPPVGNGSSDIFTPIFLGAKGREDQKALTPLFLLGEYIPFPSVSKYGVYGSFYPNKTETIFKDQDVEPTKKQIYYSADDITRHVEEIASYGTKEDYNLLCVTFLPDLFVLICKLRSSSSRSFEVF
ncbi:hypothetical protein ACTFIR_003949 [Dictyostelium discoideum]